ncbi:MAG: pilus assembly protein [Methylocystis sp.]|jgi:Flp pilus assembly pilin Flp
MRRQLLQFCLDENGTTVLEYAWIASLISIAAISAFHLIGSKMQTWYWPIVNNLAS